MNGAAVVLVAHGERGGAFSNEILKGHAKTVADALPGVAVSAGVLSGTPTLEEALADVGARTPGPILLYPFFMASGYFVNVKIPKRIADAGFGHRYRVLEPLGLAPPLPALIRERALMEAEKAGMTASEARLLLVGHGSKVARASAEATEMVAACLRELGGFAKVSTAFLEEAPFLDDVVAEEQRATVVVGYFNGDGLHAAQDVPEALADFAAPVIYTGPVGAFSEVSAMIAETVRKAIASGPATASNPA